MKNNSDLCNYNIASLQTSHVLTTSHILTYLDPVPNHSDNLQYLQLVSWQNDFIIQRLPLM